PARTRPGAPWVADAAAGSPGAYARRQGRGTRTASDLHAVVQAEPDVALDHVVHVLDPVAEHHGPLEAHAEGEPAVAVGVDAAGAQHVRVDHAAAAPLDPAGALAGAAVRVLAAADEAQQV